MRMTIAEICHHERRGMMTRRVLGYAQHDDHLWRWLNYHLAVWGSEHRIKVVEK